MNRYLMVRRLCWPLLLLLVGVLALLHQADILHWGQSWPLFLIYFGVMKLVERAALNFDVSQAANGYADTTADSTTGTGSVATGHVETTGADETISTHSSKGVQL